MFLEKICKALFSATDNHRGAGVGMGMKEGVI